MSDVWTCCGCGAPNLMAIAPVACPVCNEHNRCQNCRVGPPSPHLSSPGPLFPSQNYRSGHSYDTHHRLSSPPSWNAPSAPPRNASIATTANTYRTSSTRGLSYGSYNYAQGSQYALHQGSRGAPGGSHGGNVDPHTPPSMAGWWKCCRCGQRNNPDLCPERCSLDGHRKCCYCK